MYWSCVQVWIVKQFANRFQRQVIVLWAKTYLHFRGTTVTVIISTFWYVYLFLQTQYALHITHKRLSQPASSSTIIAQWVNLTRHKRITALHAVCKLLYFTILFCLYVHTSRAVCPCQSSVLTKGQWVEKIEQERQPLPISEITQWANIKTIHYRLTCSGPHGNNDQHNMSHYVTPHCFRAAHYFCAVWPMRNVFL